MDGLAYTFSEADVNSTSLPMCAIVERGTAGGGTGVWATARGGNGNGRLAGTAAGRVGVLFSGGSIPAARREANNELSPPAGIGAKLGVA